MWISRFMLPLLGLAVATPALAHVGVHTTGSFMAGLSHPFSGFDHLLAMLAVGLWAACGETRRIWVAPAGFLVGMLAGGLAGLGGLYLPGVEGVILASILLFGALGVFAARLAPLLAFGGAALLASAHGLAHGAEMPMAGNPITYGIGVLLATTALLGIGAAAGLAAKHLQVARLGQAASGALAAAGLVLMVS